MSDDLEEAIAQLWQVFAPHARARVELLESYLTTLQDVPLTDAPPQDQDVEQRNAAAAAAHKLAGSLGSYLRPGSVEAADLEDLLLAPGPVQHADVAPLVQALRAAVAA